MADLEDDALKIAKYLYHHKCTGEKSIVASDLRKAVKLSSSDFGPADQYLLGLNYVNGTLGGDAGDRWLTPVGIHFVKSKTAQTGAAKRRWSRGDTFALAGLVLAIIAIIVSLTVPEVRHWLGLK